MISTTLIKGNKNSPQPLNLVTYYINMNDKNTKNSEELAKEESTIEQESVYLEKSSSNKSRNQKRSDRPKGKGQSNSNSIRPDKMNENDFQNCLFITNKLSESVYAFSFRTPPEPTDEDAISFLKATEHPMDFQTLTNNLNNQVYKTVADWRKDITLIFDNALNYFSPKLMAYESAAKLKAKFLKLNTIFTKTEEELWMTKIEKICSEYIAAENEQ